MDDDIHEELQTHLDEARAKGRDAGEYQRAFGSRLRTHEATRDAVLTGWVDSLLKDVTFGWRQLRRHQNASLAAVLSLALGIGSCITVFRLIDALLLRPLPVEKPSSLYVMGIERRDGQGRLEVADTFDYPGFQRIREALKGQVEVLAVDAANRIGITFGSDEDMERVQRQYVSGRTFAVFGLAPAAGRLLSESDDEKPGGHPVAVLSHAYWTRRFGGDPQAVGRTFRSGNDVYTIIGITPQGFTGTSTGRPTDLFMPTMMNAQAIGYPNWNWISVWLQLREGLTVQAVRGQLQAVVAAYGEEQLKLAPPGMIQQRRTELSSRRVVLNSATSGVSNWQENYRQPLWILAGLVGLVLLISGVNVANLRIGQAASRDRELALRVGLGAGRARVLQLLAAESAIVSLAASILGLLFSLWAAPFVTGMINPPEDALQLPLRTDYRVVAFAGATAFLVTILFGLAPAWRSSKIGTGQLLRGSGGSTRMWGMNLLIAGQMGFCLLVLAGSAMFLQTLDHLSAEPLGFSPENLLALSTVSRQSRPVEEWHSVAERLQRVPGVESVGVANWALLSGTGWNGGVWINGKGPDPPAMFLTVSPGWLGTMKIPILSGRDFRRNDKFPRVAAVNRTFARRYFGTDEVIGRTFETAVGRDRVPVTVLAVVGDARYDNLRGSIPATVYWPFADLGNAADSTNFATLLIRGSLPTVNALIPTLRRELTGTGFRIATFRTQEELVRMQTIRERLLAALSSFFGAVALVLAIVGTFGVLQYSVARRRRELGIRIALGATRTDIATSVSAGLAALIGLGALMGLGASFVGQRYVAALLYQVEFGDPGLLLTPLMVLLAAAVLAATPPVLRAVRIDPAELLRTD